MARQKKKLERDTTSRVSARKGNIETSLLEATLESTADGILVVDRQGAIVMYNQKFRKMWHIPPGVLKTGSDDEAIHHVLRQLKDPEGFVKKLMELYTHPEMDCFDEIEFQDGRIFERYSIPQLLGNEIVGRVFSFRDVTRRKQMEEQLLRQATYDALTGLPNRILLEDRIDQNIKHARRRGLKVGVLFFDLDRFKLVNDSLGHNMGDALLKSVAERLTKCIREGDTLARWGGDEFVIVLSDLKLEEDVISIIVACQTALEEVFIIDNRTLSITSSVGASFYPRDGNDSTILLKNADAAMYNAKSEGPNNYRFYRPQMNELAIEQLALETDLHKALEHNEFFLHYQPLVDLRTGQVKSAEALLRWRHPIRGLVPPLDFIEIAEETGLIQSIGEWVLNTACAQNKKWQDLGFPPIKVAVNVSGIQFKQKNIVQVIQKALSESRLDPQYLDLELTESSIMENTHTFMATMNAIKEIGVGLVIDDFGTGYSSLGYLKRFPVNKIKIDKSFIHDITTDEDDGAIVQAIIAMAQKLKLSVVAEGVETVDQVMYLQAHNCDEIQGYYFSPPVAPEKYEIILKQQGEGLRPKTREQERVGQPLFIDDIHIKGK
jgi:diguanylate cyclase (GGDEF)-like protein/PAS domain S-box-containing protein